MRLGTAWATKFIYHERFVFLWLVSFTLFFVVWVLSYLLLPEGVLRGRLLSASLLGKDVNFLDTFVRIFAFNFLIGGVLVSIVCNFFRVAGLPLSYAAIWGQISLFGILKGTNSFLYPYPTMLDSVMGFLRTGLWEFTAYILMASAFVSLGRYEQKSWLSFETTRIPESRSLSPGEKRGYLLGVVILFASAATETLAIFGILP